MPGGGSSSPLSACVGGFNPGLLDCQKGLFRSHLGLQQHPQAQIHSYDSSMFRRKKAKPISLRKLCVGAKRSHSFPDGERGKGMYSPLFMVQKKNGTWRPVIDLAHLDHFTQK